MDSAETVAQRIGNGTEFGRSANESKVRQIKLDGSGAGPFDNDVQLKSSMAG